jgi:hypothetical protein
MRATSNHQPAGQPESTGGSGITVLAVIVCAAVICGSLYLIGANWNAQEDKRAPAASQVAPSGPGPAIGMEAPEISGEDLEGAPFKLSDYRGKVVLLDFWGNW